MSLTRQPNILLIEDDLMVRQALGRALACENYRVFPARNHQEALSEFQRQRADQPIDIVLLDLNPPNENPWETVGHLTALQPDLPVVAMTARVEEEVSMANAISVDALMEKPLDLPLLMATLTQLTSKPPRVPIKAKLPTS
jgi:DNA-binding response OmpR family regulator